MRLTSFVFAAVLTTVTGRTLMAETASQGAVSVENAWARATPEGAKAGGVYVNLKNNGQSDDKIVSVQSPAAAKAEIHEHIKDGDVMRMREVAGGLPIPAGATVEMKPGGYHIMLMGLKQRLTEGATIPVTLTFEKAGKIAVEASVRKDEPVGDAGMPAGHMH